jgi:hypothetical protein
MFKESSENSMKNASPTAIQVQFMKEFQRMPDGKQCDSLAGDGVQTQLKGAKAQRLRDLWATGWLLRAFIRTYACM